MFLFVFICIFSFFSKGWAIYCLKNDTKNRASHRWVAWTWNKSVLISANQKWSFSHFEQKNEQEGLKNWTKTEIETQNFLEMFFFFWKFGSGDFSVENLLFLNSQKKKNIPATVVRITAKETMLPGLNFMKFWSFLVYF